MSLQKTLCKAGFSFLRLLADKETYEAHTGLYCSGIPFLSVLDIPGIKSLLLFGGAKALKVESNI